MARKGRRSWESRTLRPDRARRRNGPKTARGISRLKGKFGAERRGVKPAPRVRKFGGHSSMETEIRGTRISRRGAPHASASGALRRSGTDTRSGPIASGRPRLEAGSVNLGRSRFEAFATRARHEKAPGIAAGGSKLSRNRFDQRSNEALRMNWRGSMMRKLTGVPSGLMPKGCRRPFSSTLRTFNCTLQRILSLIMRKL